jgi:hypothetical protein
VYQTKKTPTPEKKIKGVNNAPNNEILTYDQSYWTKRLKQPTSSTLNVRIIITGLSLQRYDTGSDGKVKFENTNLKALSKSISKIVNTLLQDEKALVGIATDPEELQPEVDGLLLRFGHRSWGRDQWQRLPMDEHDKYDPDDLVYAKPGDMKKISHFLRLWILVRAFDLLAYGNEDNDSTLEISDRKEKVRPNELDETLLPTEAYHAEDEEEEVVLDNFCTTPSTPEAHQGLDEEGRGRA